MSTRYPLFLFVATILIISQLYAQQTSPATQGCIVCHETITPGIVGDWETSLHSTITPTEALQKPDIEQRISTTNVPDSLSGNVIGCAECHTLNPKSHNDTFAHNGNQVHIVVTPEDCGVCHPLEKGQYLQSKMSHARYNLAENQTYQQLVHAVNGNRFYSDGELTYSQPDSITNTQSCYYCHGTEVKVSGMETRQTMFGQMNFPKLSGWPNQGTGRVNPDQSMGSCTSCHARHSFSIEMARKPYTCGECHKGPDVLAYKVYSASKMGNMYSTHKSDWNFDSVPWKVGKDITAPTCATCHMSLLTDNSGNVIVRRSHQLNDRLYVRLFGLPYAHPQPRSPSTYSITNSAGLKLPTELDGHYVDTALISPGEQSKRKTKMQSVCQSCHSTQWVTNHFHALDHIVKLTNEQTYTATLIMQEAWNLGLESGIPQQSNIFDETMERLWMNMWFFNANSVRLATAMAGIDYGVFDNGRYQMTLHMQELKDWLQLKRQKIDVLQ